MDSSARPQTGDHQRGLREFLDRQAGRRRSRVKVLGDLYHGRVPAGAVYVGRAAPGLPESPYANPHRVGKPCRSCHGAEHTRGAAIIAYRRYLEEHPELVEQARVELAGRDLACWCHPTEACHADVLLELINGWPSVTQPGSGARLAESDRDPAKYDTTEENC